MLLAQYGLNLDMILIVALILGAGLLFVTELVRLDAAAMMVLIFLGLTHIIPSDLLFSGFSSDAVIALIGVMIVGAGLDKSGAMIDVARWIVWHGKDRESWLRFLLMLVAGLMAGILRSVGAVALLLPVITRVARRTGYSKSIFLMPVAFCAVMGSCLTVMGATPLILLNSLLASKIDNNTPELANITIGMFEVFPIGLSLMAVCLVYYMVAHRYILPKDRRERQLPGSSKEYFAKTYCVGGDLWEIRIPIASQLVNLSLAQLEEKMDPTIAVVGLKFGNRQCVPPLRSELIKPHTMLAILGDRKNVQEFADAHGLRISPFATDFAEHLNPAVSGLTEVVVPPSSGLIGQQYSELHMRQMQGVQVLAVYRDQQVICGRALQDLVMRPGDTLGLFCQWEKMINFERNPNYVIVTSDYPHEVYRRDKKIYALGFFILGLVLIIGNYVSLPIAFLIGAMGMVFTGVMTIDEAYEAVSWKTVFILAGMLPLGIAIQVTHMDAWLTDLMITYMAHWSILSMLTAMLIITTMLTLLVSQVAATIIMAPLALHLAEVVGASPKMFGLAVALAASNAFIVPIHQANSLIVGPGHYRNMDFFRAGFVLTGLYWVVILITVPYFFG